MRLTLRWVSNCLAIFLALYLLDSVSSGGFRVKSWWVALVAGVLLGLLNSTVRPRSRIRGKPARLFVWVVAILVVNTLVIQIFVWSAGILASRNLLWTIAAGFFVAAIAQLITWLIGFDQKHAGTKETAPATPERARERNSGSTRGSAGRD